MSFFASSGQTMSTEPETVTPIFILVRPQLGENIGMGMRAMANFGCHHLRLVNPRADWSRQAAIDASAGAAAVILPHLRIFSTTAEAVADIHYLIATTARRRDLNLPLINGAQAGKYLRSHLHSGRRTAILFGGERNGLHNDDIVSAQTLVTFATDAACPSLNLAQTMMLMAYEYSAAETLPPSPKQDETPPPLGEIEFFCRTLDSALSARGFYRSPEMRPHMRRNIRTMVQRLQPSQQDLRTLHGIVKTLMRSL